MESELCCERAGWVLVRAGKRGVAENFFIEPSTGRRYTRLLEKCRTPAIKITFYLDLLRKKES